MFFAEFHESRILSAQLQGFISQASTIPGVGYFKEGSLRLQDATIKADKDSAHWGILCSERSKIFPASNSLLETTIPTDGFTMKNDDVYPGISKIALVFVKYRSIGPLSCSLHRLHFKYFKWESTENEISLLRKKTKRGGMSLPSNFLFSRPLTLTSHSWNC